EARRERRKIDGAAAAHGLTPAAAARGPARDQVEVGGQAPRAGRGEHVILEHEVSGVGPIVRDVTLVVVAHHVGGGAVGAGWVGGVQATAPPLRRAADETVHLASVDVGASVGAEVRAAAV